MRGSAEKGRGGEGRRATDRGQGRAGRGQDSKAERRQLGGEARQEGRRGKQLTGDMREGQAGWRQGMAEDGAGVAGRAGEGMAEDGGGGKQCLAEGEPVPLHARCSTSPNMAGTRASRRPG